MPTEAAPPPVRSAEEIEAIRRKADRRLCEQSFVDFLYRLTIRSDDPHNPAPKRLTPYPRQVELADRWQNHESQVILKRRQFGASVLLRAYALWRAAYHGWNIGYYSRGIEEADEWLEGVVNMDADLAPHLRVKKSRRGRVAKFGTGSVRVFPGTQKAGIGYTFQLVIADEAAHHKYGRENYDNYSPTLAAGGQFICLSTADPALGPTGWFYEMWTAASNGVLPYTPVFIDRWARPDQSKEWFEAEAKRYAGNVAALLANYPEEPEQAFQGREGLVYGWDSITNQPIFDRTRNVRATLPIGWADCRWRIAAIDPGGRDPTAIVPLGVGSVEADVSGARDETATGNEQRAAPGDVFIVPGLFYRRGAVSAQEMSDWLGQLHALGPIDIVFVDPSQSSLIATLRMLGWNAHPGPNSKLEGIGAVRAQLMAGRLFLSSHCEPLIHEFETYWWPKPEELRAGGSASDTRTGKGHHADALDSLRYAVLGIMKGLPRGSGVVAHSWSRKNREEKSRQGLREAIVVTRRRRIRSGSKRGSMPAERP